MKKIILLFILTIFIIGCAEKQIEQPEKEQATETPQQETPQEVITETAEEQVNVSETTTQEGTPMPAEEKAPEETQTDWPTFHGDLARTGFSASKAPSKPNVLWKWVIGDFIKIGYDESFDENWPIIAGNNAFFAAGNIFAFELKTGKLVWRYSDEGNFYPRGLAAGDGKLFVSVNTDDDYESSNFNFPPGFIYALDEKTGNFLWKYQTQKGIPYSLPLFADGKVFVGDNSGNVYAIGAANGGLIWKKYLEGAAVIHSSPAYDDGIIFIGTEDSIGASSKPSHLYALDAETGEVIWKFAIDVVGGKLNLVHSTPAILDDIVYFGAENGYFYALNSKDGSLVWKQKIASGSGEIIGTSAAAALGYGKVFIGTFEGKFLALDQADGKTVWEYTFGKTEADSSPVVADGKVYFGAGKGDFYSFDAATGKVIWKEKLGGLSAALADGILIVRNARIEDEPEPQTPVIIAFSDEGKLSLW